ncbi:hypothetical protein [Clostridium vincentii]|uniref:Uncharacterized protein n=1 Tax=Clostridium vincentii TaxID=52704 RepID=A0A2T0BL95_9CLOT|nr:hypothetical protein [Clostridium vincentii]PRR84651.1 hypothetical protein CLVI_01740 [Clostridium vincentii]
MVIVFSPLCQKEIIKAIESFEIDGDQVFSIKEREGMKLIFNSTIENEDEACKVAKKIMSGIKYSSGLNYCVVSYDGKEIKWIT